MPTYEYRCQFCHEYVEAFQRMSDAPLTTCPHCGKEGLSRIVSGGAGVIYKGEGWYVTDYSKKSSGGKEIPTGEASSKSTGSKSGANSSSSDSVSTNASTGASESASSGKPAAKNDAGASDSVKTGT